MFEKDWGVLLQIRNPACVSPYMIDAAIDGSFKGLYVQGEDIAQSDPNTQHITAGLTAMECLVVQDLFLNETASFAHVFLPGCTFLEKDGTFTNAERRINRVRRAIAPANGLADWEITMRLSTALGYLMHYNHPSEIMDEIARADARICRGVSYAKLEQAGSVQSGRVMTRRRKVPRSCTSAALCECAGRFMLTEFVPTEERVTPGASR